MRKFLYKIFLFSGCTLVLLLGLIIVTNFLLKTKSRLTVGKDKSIVIIGHSQPECAYNDSLINDLSNFGSSGESYFYNYYKIRRILEQNKNVKTVLIEFSNNQIDEVMDDWTWDDTHLRHKYSLYGPFIDMEGNEFLFNRNVTGYIGNLGASLFYNLYVMAGSHDYTKRVGGYLYLIRDKTKEILAKQERSHSPYEIKRLSTSNIKYLKAIVKKCKQLNVNVYLIRSPIHKKSNWLSNEKIFQRVLRNELKGVEFLDFKDFPMTDNEFGDLEHLNFKGARKYSLFFNQILQENLLLKSDKKKFLENKISKLSSSINL